MNTKTTKTAFVLLLVVSQSVFANPVNFQIESKSIDFKSAIQLANWRPTSNSAQFNRSRSFSNSEYGSGSNSSWLGFRGLPAVAQKGPANEKGTIVLSPRTLSWAAYDSEGDLVKSGRASLGRDWCPDTGGNCRTPTGNFQIYAYQGADCVSKKYPLITDGGAPMPYCMFFHGGYAIHGAYDVPNWNASHGCVRITPAAAQWLQYNFATIGTKVVVRSY